MGMDVYGIAPTSKAGEYFWASIWEWPSIHELIALLCGDLLGTQTLVEMAYNGGAGTNEPEVCAKMAERFEAWLTVDPRQEFVWAHDSGSLRITQDGRLISENELAENPDLVTKSPYCVRRKGVMEFVEFLKSCGGFCVW